MKNMYVYPCLDKTIGIIWKQSVLNEFKKCPRCGIIQHKEKDFFHFKNSDVHGCKRCRNSKRKLLDEKIVSTKNVKSHKYNKLYNEPYLSLILNKIKEKESIKKYEIDRIKYKTIKSLRYNHGKVKCKYCDNWHKTEDLPSYLQKKIGNSYCHSCWKQSGRKWQLENKERHNYNCLKYTKQRYKTDPLFKFSMSVRQLIGLSIRNKGYKKTSKTATILGCDFETFRIHIERQFTKGMNWENRSEWHLDHIYPVSLAKDEKHIIELNHYTNFQPLWAIDNMSKGNKIVEHQIKIPI